MTDKLIEQINASRSGKGSGPWTRDMEDRILADAEVIKAAEELAEQCETAFDNVDGGAPPAFYNALDAFNRAMQSRKGGE